MNIQAKLTTLATDLPFAMYDAFTAVPYSGSQSAIVLDASAIAPENRARIAREIGAPASSFVDAICGDRITVQFYSTVMELPMCGHGTICLVTHLVESGRLPCDTEGCNVAVLDTPKGEAKVEYRRNVTGGIDVMLDVAEALFTPANLDLAELADMLGVSQSDFATKLPIEVATADFVHLCLAMRDIEAMRALQPNFVALADFCVSNGVETVAVFSIQAVDETCDLHVRDFCPAVGVAESAAAGTTNAALASYLLRNGCVHADIEGSLVVRAEQGIELGRPSKVITKIETKDGGITRLQVGGVATRIMSGVLNTKLDAHD